MNKKSEMPPEIADLLNEVPETTDEMLEEISNANRDLFNDPDFIADYERSKFIESLLEAMDEGGITRSQLARKIGKSRQYIQKLLDEDNRVSYHDKDNHLRAKG